MGAHRGRGLSGTVQPERPLLLCSLAACLRGTRASVMGHSDKGHSYVLLLQTSEHSESKI